MKIVVVDGQGGRMGKAIIEGLAAASIPAEIFAIGTNGIATAAMLKAGAAVGATGQNPLIVNCRDADFIIGPIGIVIADALFGEISPEMAKAVGQSSAEKLLLPVNRCNNHVIGVADKNVSALIAETVNWVQLRIAEKG